MTEEFQYMGQELKLFENANNWKAYLRQEMKSYIKGNVLEVGAGYGATTKALNDGSATSWTLLEPDFKMFAALCNSIDKFPQNTKAIRGTIEQVSENFDTILYIDVLEHIEDDREELKNAAARLKKDGSLIVLAPAYNHLFSPFDEAIGHYRRYTKQMLKKVMPEGVQTIKLRYLDSFGFIASAANKLLLRQSLPSQNQIDFWDKYLVSTSKHIDPFIRHRFGKSVLGVWRPT